MTQSYYNPGAGLGMGTSGSEANRYGAYQNVAEAARNRQREGLGSARRDMAYQIAGMTSAGANPFGAARAADRAYQAQAGDIRQQASEQMQQAAAMEAQRREEEMLRRQQEARQFLGAGLSTAGAVLGTVVGGPIGAQAGGGLGGMVGGGLTGIGGQPGAARQMAGQQAAAPATPSAQQSAPSMGLVPPGASGPTGLRAGISSMIDPSVIFGGSAPAPLAGAIGQRPRERAPAGPSTLVGPGIDAARAPGVRLDETEIGPFVPGLGSQRGTGPGTRLSVDEIGGPFWGSIRTKPGGR